MRPFDDRHIELVTTFADQAVIAIENVRLFEEVQARTQELTETLLSLDKDAPIPRTIQTVGRTLAMPVLGGLHHQYFRAAPCDPKSETAENVATDAYQGETTTDKH